MYASLVTLAAGVTIVDIVAIPVATRTASQLEPFTVIIGRQLPSLMRAVHPARDCRLVVRREGVDVCADLRHLALVLGKVKAADNRKPAGRDKTDHDWQPLWRASHA